MTSDCCAHLRGVNMQKAPLNPKLRMDVAGSKLAVIGKGGSS